MLEQFSSLWEPVRDQYPDVPVQLLRRSGLYKLISEASRLLGVPVGRGLALMGMQDSMPIGDWSAFLKETQGVVPEPFAVQFTRILNELEAPWGADSKYYGKVDALKSFAGCFMPPYLSSDINLWRGVAAVTYEPLCKHERTAELLASFASDPFELEYGTGLNQVDAFEELTDGLAWPDDRNVKW